MNTVSIILPIYKVEKYIERCLQSVFRQTYPAEEIECVIVNDCTPDGSMDIVNSMIDGYTGAMRFKIINHDTNKGISVTRNSGIDAATGHYLLFIDSDDYITPDCVATLVNGIESHGTDMAIGNSYNHASGSHHHRTDSAFVVNGQENIEKDVLCMTSAAFPWNRIVRREQVVNNNIYFEPGIIHQDLLWNLLLSKHIGSVAYLPECTYSYEQNEGSIQENAKKDRNPAAKAFLTILSESIKMTTAPCRNEYHLFGVHFALELLYCLWGGNITSVTMDDFRPLRQSLMRQAKSMGLPALAASLIMYKPFWYVSRTRWFRNHRVDLRFRLLDIMNKKRQTK